MGKENLEKSYNGLLIVRAKNGNFNAGFDGNPRTLPDGTIFATDKALKYCLREFLSLFGNELVFVKRDRKFKDDKKKGKVLSYETLEENFENKLGLLQEKGLYKHVSKEELIRRSGSKTETHHDEKIMEILKQFIDVRMFGVVFSVGSNISLTGPVQISYGINKLEGTNIYPVQILSPYKNSNESSKDSHQTTIGEETRADEAYYVYNISVNAANARKTGMNGEDLQKLKHSLLSSVDPITSCTKFGCESVALVWIQNDENIVLNNLDDFVRISKSEEDVVLDLSKLEEYLKPLGYNQISTSPFKYDKDLGEEDKKSDAIEVIYKSGKISLSK